MQGPSVLFINRVYPPQRGATGRILKDLAHAFAREGWNVKIICTGEHAAIERDNSIRVIRTKGPERPQLITYPWLWLKLLSLGLKQETPDLVISMTDPPLTVAAGRIIARRKKAKHIHWCQDYYPAALKAMHLSPPGFLFRLLNTWTIRALKRCDKVIVIGRCMAQKMIHDGVEQTRISVIPNWPDAELVRPGKKEAHHFNDASSDAAMKIGSKPHLLQMKTGPKFRVLYAGNIGRAHPVKPILEAASLLQDAYPEIEFTFVGDGKRFDALARERDKRGLENIRFLPYQPANRLREVMESGDVHLISLANAAKGCMVPSKLYAALAVSRPVVFMGPAKSEAARVIHDFQAGEIVEPGNAGALAEIIKNYRLDGEYWFEAYHGAVKAGQIFVPEEAIKTWIQKALGVIQGLNR